MKTVIAKDQVTTDELDQPLIPISNTCREVTKGYYDTIIMQVSDGTEILTLIIQ